MQDVEERGMSIEVNELVADTRAAMRRLAKSVVILTTSHQGQRLAMAATAVDSLSMEPPSLLACVNRSASIFAAFQAKLPFCVNILARNHEALAQRCGGQVKGEARFAEGDWRERQGIPYLGDAQANIFCANDGEFYYGTHGVFVGRVTDVALFGSIEPLIYADARYVGAHLAM
ncbi:flavin reductase (DIM6/NTAB) family NADH-FMN oxidoreductase RutF [Aminobacter ciceronei]|nr:flavin reductase (DIM6/NTAB) family NADH-FMN oxidoreductase RutF [Aminobacter ciceronei]